MFGYSLSRAEERAVLELLGYVATIDREVTPEERQFVVELSHDFNASSEGVFRIAEEKSLEEIGAALGSQTARRLGLVYGIRLGFVDGLYHRDEWLGIRALSDALRVPDDIVADLEDWVRRGLEWEEEGRELLDLDSRWAI